MALYLPKHHLVFDIVDDPRSAPVDPDAFGGLTVVPVTRDELAHPERLCAVDGALAADGRPERSALSHPGVRAQLEDLLARGGIAAAPSSPRAERGAA